MLIKYWFLFNDSNHEKYRIEYFIGFELYEISNQRICYSLFDNLYVQRKIRCAVRNFCSKYMYLTLRLFYRHRHNKNVINSECQKKKKNPERDFHSICCLSNCTMHECIICNWKKKEDKKINFILKVFVSQKGGGWGISNKKVFYLHVKVIIGSVPSLRF